MSAGKNRRGPQSVKSQKRKQKSRTQTRETKPPSQTNQPFEQDTKRRVGQHMGTGKPPMMKK